MGWELERITTAKKLEEEEWQERQKRKLKEQQKIQAEEDLFFDVFNGNRYQYPMELNKMISDDYHADSGNLLNNFMII